MTLSVDEHGTCGVGQLIVTQAQGRLTQQRCALALAALNALRLQTLCAQTHETSKPLILWVVAKLTFYFDDRPNEFIQI